MKNLPPATFAMPAGHCGSGGSAALALAGALAEVLALVDGPAFPSLPRLERKTPTPTTAMNATRPIEAIAMRPALPFGAVVLAARIVSCTGVPIAGGGFVGDCGPVMRVCGDGPTPPGSCGPVMLMPF